MKLSTAIQFVVASLTAVAAAKSDKNITYNVVSPVPNNQIIGVIVDDNFYPLTHTNKASNLLHYGQAPVPKSNYKYAVARADSNEIIHSENFTRTNSEGEDTLNEYYGRSWNTYDKLKKLPAILPPLPIINRIESDLHVEGRIPTIHFFGNQTEIDHIHNNQMLDTKIQLNMTYISPNEVKTFPEVKISISGMSSRRMDKLSYKIKIPKKEELFGYRRLKLRAMPMDVSYMRDSLGYSIAESVGLPTTKHSYTRVYINNQPIGLFGLVEHFKSTWVRNQFGNGSKKFEQGALYIADINVGQGNTTQEKPSLEKRFELPSGIATFVNGSETVTNPNATSSLSYLGDNIDRYSAGQYDVKEDPSVGTANFTRIMDLTRFISEQPTTPVNNSVIPNWEEKMDVESFLRGLALEIVISNSDGYLGFSNNYVLYDDIANERLIFSTQDLDVAMGTTMYTPEITHGGNYSNFPGFNVRPLMRRMMQVPKFKQDFEDLLVKYTKELVNPTILGARIDQLYDMLSEDVAWDKSLPRVGKMLLFGAPIDDTSSFSAANFTFEQGVYGPTLFPISMALTEWLSLRSSNLLTFFNQTSV